MMKPANRFHIEKKADDSTAAIIRFGVTATAMMPYMVQYCSVANMKKANQKKLPVHTQKLQISLCKYVLLKIKSKFLLNSNRT